LPEPSPPWTQTGAPTQDPLDTQPPLLRAHMRTARFKRLRVGEQRHAAWLLLIDGCASKLAADELFGCRVFMHVRDIPGSTQTLAAAPPPPPQVPRSLVASAALLQGLHAEDVRGFRAFVPLRARAGGQNAPAWLQGASCVGRIMDVYRDDRRFFDCGAYIDAVGRGDLPGQCAVFRVAFQKGLVLHAPLERTGDSSSTLHARPALQTEAAELAPLAALSREALMHVRVLAACASLSR
jgi:hypothetical protein